MPIGEKVVYKRRGGDGTQEFPKQTSLALPPALKNSLYLLNDKQYSKFRLKGKYFNVFQNINVLQIFKALNFSNKLYVSSEQTPRHTPQPPAFLQGSRMAWESPMSSGPGTQAGPGFEWGDPKGDSVGDSKGKPPAFLTCLGSHSPSQ